MWISFIRKTLLRLTLAAAAFTVLASCASGPRPVTVLPPPDLRRPPDTTTRLRMQALADNQQVCRITLEHAGIKHRFATPLSRPNGCGYQVAVSRQPMPGLPGWTPQAPAVSCPTMAALVIFERDILLPAARRIYGEDIVSIRQIGTYGCRTIGNQQGGTPSEHSRANAIDIAGFRLASGREISVLKDWNGNPRDQAFLRELRAGACKLFGTVLTPDYNAAHADHFHFDQANRRGGSFCR